VNWAEVAALIVKYGVEQAFKIWEIARDHNEPDEAAWEKLRALALKDYDSYLRDAQERARAAQASP
jgi:hypothetical protein